jgi:phosphoribosyl 1,2-cyclic phosphodiesterase
MALRFTVLASGSGGNASLVEVDGKGVLIDAGLGPRQLGARLAAVGLSWTAVHALLLTHTHGDHWKDRSLGALGRRQATLFCHRDHHAVLESSSPAFVMLRKLGLVQTFEAEEPFAPVANLSCRALPVRHDSGATFAFRLEGPRDLFGRVAALGYAADLGCWDNDLADALADVDLLALEFNHDVTLERLSGRGARLIARVLGAEGHLSNVQAAHLLGAVISRSPAGRLKHVVQLHLSNECNRPSLARAAAEAVVEGMDVGVHTAAQDAPGATFHLQAVAAPTTRGPRGKRILRRGTAPEFSQPLLPGFEE